MTQPSMNSTNATREARNSHTEDLRPVALGVTRRRASEKQGVESLNKHEEVGVVALAAMGEALQAKRTASVESFNRKTLWLHQDAKARSFYHDQLDCPVN